MFVPKSHGGLAVDALSGMEILETISRADGATGWTAMIGCETPHLLALLPRERFDAIYSAAPDVIIGGAFNAQGEARVVDGGYRVTGRSYTAASVPTGPTTARPEGPGQPVLTKERGSHPSLPGLVGFFGSGKGRSLDTPCQISRAPGESPGDSSRTPPLPGNPRGTERSLTMARRSPAAR
jgi:hypothetical protein